jgi:hypothetical protein
VSTGIFEHWRTIREAIWLFLYLIDATTKEYTEPDGRRMGSVLGGRPVRDSELARVFGTSERTIRTWRKRLSKFSYIVQKRTPFGHTIAIANSQKWPDRPEESFPSDRKESSGQTGSNGQCDRKQRSVGSEESVETKKTRQYKTVTEQKNNPPNPPEGELGGFDAFWKSYPRKVSKGDARKAWRKLKPDLALQETILGAIETQKESREWAKERGRYIPYPASWLNAEGWTNELQPMAIEFDILDPRSLKVGPSATERRPDHQGRFPNKAEQRTIDNARAVQEALRMAAERERREASGMGRDPLGDNENE